MTTDFQLKPGHSCCYKILDLKPIFYWLSWYYSSRVRKVLPLIDTEWSGWFLLLLGGSWGSPCGLYRHNDRDDFILSLHSVSEFTCLECWDISLESFKYRSLGSSRFPGLCCHESGYSSVQSLSCVRLFVTPWTAARQASLSITNSQSLPKLISIELVMPSNHLILCCPLLLLLSILPSIRVFSSESVLHMKWPKYWSFSLNISSSNEHSGLLSLRIDWLDLIAVQGTLKSLLQHHSSKASILCFSVQFSSVSQSCATLCDPMKCSMPGLPVHHQLPEFTHIHLHWVGDAIQPSHPLLSPSPPTFNLSQHQSLFKRVSSSHHMVKVLEFQLKHQSF